MHLKFGGLRGLAHLIQVLGTCAERTRDAIPLHEGHELTRGFVGRKCRLFLVVPLDLDRVGFVGLDSVNGEGRQLVFRMAIKLVPGVELDDPKNAISRNGPPPFSALQIAITGPQGLNEKRYLLGAGGATDKSDHIPLLAPVSARLRIAKEQAKNRALISIVGSILSVIFQHRLNLGRRAWCEPGALGSRVFGKLLPQRLICLVALDSPNHVSRWGNV